MYIYEINPFIRYAMKINLEKPQGMVYSRDCRLFFIMEGSACISSDGIKYRIERDDVMLLSGGTEYEFLLENPLKIAILNFDYTQNNRNIKNILSPVPADEFTKNMILENTFFEDCPALNEPLFIKSIPEISDKIKNIISVYSKKEMYFNEQSSALLKDVIMDLLQNALFTSSSVLSKIENAIVYIQKHYSENITNEDIAKKIGYHPYHLNKLMLKYTGLTMHKYLLEVRLEKAKEYLLNRNFSIAVISENCGFSSPYHFSNAFKKKYHCSPKSFRNDNRNMI